MKAIVFDLDGTLIDSAPDIHAASVRVLEDIGEAPLDLTTITSFIGNGVPRLVERVIETCRIDPARHGDLVARFLDYYDATPAELTTVYPGVREALDQLREAGFVLGVCTNKPQRPAEAVLRAFGLDGLFGAVTGGDALATRKPDPEPLDHTFDMLGATARLYVGDSEIDAECARRAGVDFALFTEGYRKSPVALLPHRFSFSDFGGLPQAAERVLAAKVG